MNNFINRAKTLLSKYLPFIVLFFAFVSSFTYIFDGLNMNTTGGKVYRMIFAILEFILLAFAFVVYKIRASKPIMVCVCLYFVCNLVAIFASSTVVGIEITTFAKLSGVFSLVCNCLLILLAVYLINNYSPDKDILRISLYAIVWFAIFLCIETYVFQFRQIGSTFSSDHGWTYSVTSIFLTKTTYGFCLFVASVCSAILVIITKKYWLYAATGFFAVNAVISRNKTALVCIVILLIAMLIYHFVNSYKNHKKQWLIAIGSGVLAISIFFVAVFLSAPNPLQKFFSETIFNDGITVVKDRFEKWSKVIEAMNSHPFLIIFGCGERSYLPILNGLGAMHVSDSTYIVNYAVGGIIKSILYISFAVYLIVKIAKNKNDKSYKFISLLNLSLFLLEGFMEEANIIGSSMFSLFLFIPLFLVFSFNKTTGIIND